MSSLESLYVFLFPVGCLIFFQFVSAHLNYRKHYGLHPASLHSRSAAGGSSGDGSVDVKMLAEQNVQLKEALKRLHSHSIAEKTDVSALMWARVLPSRNM